jgi:hypothetical protein
VRFKIVPEPPTGRNTEREDADPDEEAGHEDVVERAERAVPLVPASEEECCARLTDRLSLPACDAAREWLTFLRALGLVAETDSGFRRRREDSDGEALATAFRERVYGVQEVLAALDESDTPLPAETVAKRFAEYVPRWERFRHPDAEAVWEKRAKRILDWAVYFELAERIDGGYVPANDPSR